MSRQVAIPDWVAEGTRIEIRNRQTTYWDLVVRPGGSRCRVHFVNKVEFEFAGSIANRIAVRSSHPLLIEYEEPEDSLYISSPTPEPAHVLNPLHELCTRHFGGWRSLARYLNQLVAAPDLLSTGYGLLLPGPRGFISAAAELLLERGVKTQIQSHHGHVTQGTFQVLELGRSYVVAARFEFEPGVDAA
jgi:hypothetical protein